MRQPPEKVETGWVSSDSENPNPMSSVSARERAVYASASPSAACSSPRRLPSWVASNFLLQPSQRGIAINHVLDSGALQRRGLLRDVRDAPVRRQLDVALVGVQLIAQQREQAGLAGAVRADQAGAVAGVEGEVGAFEQRLRAAPEG